VLHGQEESFLAPLDVGKIPGVGKGDQGAGSTRSALFILVICCGVDQRGAGRKFLASGGQALVGKRRVEKMQARGLKARVGEEWQAKSISP